MGFFFLALVINSRVVLSIRIYMQDMRHVLRRERKERERERELRWRATSYRRPWMHRPLGRSKLKWEKKISVYWNLV